MTSAPDHTGSQIHIDGSFQGNIAPTNAMYLPPGVTSSHTTFQDGVWVREDYVADANGRPQCVGRFVVSSPFPFSTAPSTSHQERERERRRVEQELERCRAEQERERCRAEREWERFRAGQERFRAERERQWFRAEQERELYRTEYENRRQELRLAQNFNQMQSVHWNTQTQGPFAPPPYYDAETAVPGHTQNTTVSDTGPDWRRTSAHAQEFFSSCRAPGSHFSRTVVIDGGEYHSVGGRMFTSTVNNSINVTGSGMYVDLTNRQDLERQG